MSKQAEKVANKVMKDLEKILKDYGEIVNYEKTLQTSDYDSLLAKLDHLVASIGSLSQLINKNKIETEDLQPLLDALGSSLLAYRPIVVGHGAKNRNQGRYSWFAQRSDLKKSNVAKRLVASRVDNFWSHVETQYIDAPALYLDPKALGVVEGTFRMTSSEYENSEKDPNGRIFLVRFYSEGRQGVMSVPFKVWDALRIYQYDGGTEKELASAKKILEDQGLSV